MAVVRAEIPLWAGLFVTALGVAALLGRRVIYAQVDRSLAAAGMAGFPRVGAAMRGILRGGLLLVAGCWALAGLAVVVLSISGPIGD